MIECDVIAKTLVKDVVKVRYSYNCADYEKIKTTLQEIPWPELFANKKVEEMWQIFIGKLQLIITSYVPSKIFLGKNVVHGLISEQENN